MAKGIQMKCDASAVLQLVYFACRKCKAICVFGDYIIREYEELQLNVYHRKIETE